MPLNRGVLCLTHETREFLLQRDYADAVCDYAGGAFLRAMPPDHAIAFLTARGSGLARCVRLAGALVPALGERALVMLAGFLNPCRATVRHALAAATARAAHGGLGGAHGEDEDNDDGYFDADAGGEAVDTAALSELYIEVLMALQSLREVNERWQEDAETYAPWHSQPHLVLSLLERAGGSAASGPGLASRNGHAGPGSASPTLGDADARARDFALGVFSMSEDGTPDVSILSANLDSRQARSDETLACGIQHGAVILQGDVYTWGKAKGGRLGQGDIIEQTNFAPPLRVETLNMHGIKVLGVACGAEHMAVRTSHGIYTWGENDRGQLGLGNVVKHTRPERVTALDGVDAATIICGHFHTMVSLLGNKGWSALV